MNIRQPSEALAQTVTSNHAAVGVPGAQTNPHAEAPRHPQVRGWGRSGLEIDPLLQAYAALRRRWPQSWPGLPRVLSGCLAWLARGALRAERRRAPDPHVQRLRGQAAAAARIVEQSGVRKARQSREPAYHNRLHIADTLVSMTALLRARRELTRVQDQGCELQAPLQPAELLCLLAMLIHDFEHTGLTNGSRCEIERHSLQCFLPHAMAIGISLDDWAVLSRLVLNTDPASVGPLHDVFRNAPSPPDTPLTWPETAVLVTEADVLASVLPGVGEEQGEALRREWAPHYPDRARRVVTPEGRLGFLALGARFSSPAASHLGVMDAVQAQVLDLSRRIQQGPKAPAPS